MATRRAPDVGSELAPSQSVNCTRNPVNFDDLSGYVLRDRPVI